MKHPASFRTIAVRLLCTLTSVTLVSSAASPAAGDTPSVATSNGPALAFNLYPIDIDDDGDYDDAVDALITEFGDQIEPGDVFVLVSGNQTGEPDPSWITSMRNLLKDEFPNHEVRVLTGGKANVGKLAEFRNEIPPDIVHAGYDYEPKWAHDNVAEWSCNFVDTLANFRGAATTAMNGGFDMFAAPTGRPLLQPTDPQCAEYGGSWEDPPWNYAKLIRADSRLQNGFFHNGLDGWTLQDIDGQVISGGGPNGNPALRLSNGIAAAKAYQGDVTVDKGRWFRLYFQAKASTSAGTMKVNVMQDNEPWLNAGLSKTITPGTSWHPYTYEFRANDNAGPDSRLTFSELQAGTTYEIAMVQLRPVVASDLIVQLQTYCKNGATGVPRSFAQAVQKLKNQADGLAVGLDKFYPQVTVGSPSRGGNSVSPQLAKDCVDQATALGYPQVSLWWAPQDAAYVEEFLTLLGR